MLFPKVYDSHSFISSDTNKLHQRLSQPHLTKLYEIFYEADKKLSKEALFQALLDVTKYNLPEYEYETIINRMETKNKGYVTWDEFLSHIILNLNLDEIEVGYVELNQPISHKPRLQRSNHSYPINRITFYPTVYPDRTMTYLDGSILTCSCEGTVNYWSVDLEFERTAKSESTVLQYHTSWITDVVALPDVSVICLSSTERDLRFYDISARKFDLRVLITYLHSTVTAMHYHFSQNINDDSKLVLGDMDGNVQLIEINPIARGPFRSKLGEPLVQVRYENVVAGKVKGFKVTKFGKQHLDYVRQIAYYSPLKSILSCSNCSRSPFVMIDVMKEKPNYKYKILTGSGVWCFTYIEGVFLIATGSPDNIVRLWNPFVQSHAIARLEGHHHAIIALALQNNATRLYSLAQDKCIKVWNVTTQTCLQTFSGLPSELGEHSDLVAFYNPQTRDWFIGSTLIAIVRLDPLKAGEHTDGTTHCSGVSVLLYNTVHKVLVTCSLDSRIIVWNPWDGRRLLNIENAHTTTFHSEKVPIEITAASFDPSNQRLVSGAHNGTIKIWQFLSGICLRNLRLPQEHEIQKIIWVSNRILVMGWNRVVTEFADSGRREFYQDWDYAHKEDISSAAVQGSDTLATATYDGELFFWQLETGQPYKMYDISHPTSRIKIVYTLKGKKKKKKDEQPARRHGSVSSGAAAYKPTERAPSVISQSSAALLAGRRLRQSRRVSTIEMPEQLLPLRKLGIHEIMFLNTRPKTPATGTLLVALENGTIQVWSHHISGGFLTSFSAIHKAGDYIISMTTDSKNEFLFIGTCVGYIKIYLLKNYCTGSKEIDAKLTHKQMIEYRLMFPFLWGDLFRGRAQRIADYQKNPLLLHSHKGHLNAITVIHYLEEPKIILTASIDSSVRMWTIGGRYIQTLGTFKPWQPINPHFGIPVDFEHTIPRDLTRVVSYTTLRVLRGGVTNRQFAIKHLVEPQDQEDKLDSKKIYGKRLKEPILGNYYKMIETPLIRPIPLNTSAAYIPVYQNVLMPPPKGLDHVEANATNALRESLKR